MNKEDKTISLELAKKISEVAEKKGIELPESEYYWQVRDIYGVKNYLLIYGLDKTDLKSRRTIFRAYDIAELGEILPELIKLPNDERKSRIEFSQYKNNNEWLVFYTNELTTEPKILFQSNNEAEARGKTLLYLMENNLFLI